MLIPIQLGFQDVFSCAPKVY